MNMHTFGNPDNPTMMLIHGVLCPWQIWEDAAAHFSEKYYVIVPELDGHTQNAPSEFHSVAREMADISLWLRERHIDSLDVLCGLSMGGGVAAELWCKGVESHTLKVDTLILDGAPLVPAGGLTTRFITGFYADILRKSKQRDPKTLENCKKVFLPERYFEDYLRVADNMSDTSIVNICYSILQNQFPKDVPAEGTRIFYLHGTQSNEAIAKKSAKFMKKYYPSTQIKVCKGMAHAELACFHPQEWIQTVDGFLS